MLISSCRSYLRSKEIQTGEVVDVVVNAARGASESLVQGPSFKIDFSAYSS
jgi:hypothetical protein